MTGWAIDAALASALLIGVVLLLRTPVRRLFGPTVAYLLWALPALRLALPPMPEGWRDAAASLPISRAGDLVVHLVAATAAPEEPATASIALMLWLGGGAVLFAFHLIRYAAFRARILRGHEDYVRVGRVRVVLSDAAPGPLAFGVLRPHVAMPADLDRLYDADERALALAHELGHHARGDLVANWIALVVLAVHWWNPLAWIALRAFRADQELANDARVLRGRGPDAAHAYARAILKAAGGRGHAVACHLHSVCDLKGRIRMLKAGPVSPRRLVTGVAGIALLATTALATTASGTRAAAAVKERVGDTIGVDLAAAELDLAALQVPMPPAPLVPAAAPIPSVQAFPATAPVPPSPPLLSSALAMPATFAVPPAPPAPAMTPVPPMPPTPPAPGMDADRQVVVVRTRDGRAERLAMRLHQRRLPDLSAMPDIRSERCGGGDRPTIINERRDGRRVTIICSDRIERVAEAAGIAVRAAAEAAGDTREIERDALRNALDSLRAARGSIAGNPHLTGEQRRRALAGLEQGLREIQRDLDRVR